MKTKLSHRATTSLLPRLALPPRVLVPRVLDLRPSRAVALSLCALVGLAVAEGRGAQAASRPGAARALAVVLASGAGPGERGASSTQARSCNMALGAAWAKASGPGVFFVREGSIWIASRSGESGPAVGENTWATRGLKWSARPVLRLREPLSASSPLPVDGGRLLLLCTNAPTLDGALNPAPSGGREERGGRRRVAWVEAQSGRWGFLSPPDMDCYDPCLSPDGKRLAFTSSRGQAESIHSLSFEKGLGEFIASSRRGEHDSASRAERLEREPWRSGGMRQMAALARGARWMDARTLIFESTSARAGRGRTTPGLFLTTLGTDGAAGQARLLLAGAREVAVAPNGRALCAVVNAPPSLEARRRGEEPDEAEPSMLMITAPDGSGQKLLQDTLGARRPTFAGDGRAVLFDAPTTSQAGLSAKAAQLAPRSLWSVPLMRTPPVATLSNIAPPSALPRSQQASSAVAGVLSGPQVDNSNLAIVGTAFSTEWGPLSARVEVGEGEAPTRWTLLAELSTPAQNEVVARWKPPTGARGDWTLRLRVRDAAGDEAQSLLPVTLPLLLPLSLSSLVESLTPASSTSTTSTPISTPAGASRSASMAVAPTPRAVARGGLIAPEKMPRLAPAPEETRLASPQASAGFSEAAASPKATARAAKRRRAPRGSAPALSAPEVSAAVAALASPSSPSASARAGAGRAVAQVPSSVAADARLGSSASSETKLQPRDPEVGWKSDQGNVEVIGLPSRLKAGQSVSVTVRWANRSGAVWRAGNKMLLVNRFVKIDTGRRNGWSFDWMKADTLPNTQGEQVIRVKPLAPGRYDLIISVLQARGRGFAPPSGQGAGGQSRWPGEIARTVHEVEVAP